MIVPEKPGSPAEVLEHHGTKGMKWGVRNKQVRDALTVATGIPRSKSLKIQKEYAAKKASRIPQKGFALGRSSREFRAQHPTGKTQAKAIHEARKGVRERTKAIRKEKDSVERARLQRDHMNHPGTAIALRTTRGEKFVDAFILGHIRDKGIVGDVSAVSTGYSVGQAIDRRRIERTQRKGGFK